MRELYCQLLARAKRRIKLISQDFALSLVLKVSVGWFPLGGGGGTTSLFGVDGYVPLNRVWLSGS